MQKRHIAAVVILIIIGLQLVQQPTIQKPTVWIGGTVGYKMSNSCTDPAEYMRSHSYYVSNGSAISAILESCAYINSFALSHLLYNGHDYADESSILISEYEVVITFGVI